MDPFSRLIAVFLLFLPLVGSAATVSPNWDNVRVIDGDLHVDPTRFGSSISSSGGSINRNLPVPTTKGVISVPVEKPIRIDTGNGKLGRAATRFLRSLPLISTGLAIYDTVCDLTDICKDPETGELGKYIEADLVLGCNPLAKPGHCTQYKGQPISYSYVSGGLCPNINGVGFFDIHSKIYWQYNNCSVIPESGFNELTESDWQNAETVLGGYPEVVTTALINSGAPVPVTTAMAGAPVTHQIGETSTAIRDENGNLTGTKVETTTVNVTDASTAGNIIYNITETTTTGYYNSDNVLTGTETQTSDNQPPEPPEPLEFEHGRVTPLDLDKLTINAVAVMEEAEQDEWSSGSVCPPDVEIGIYNLTFPSEPLCNFAQGVRPVVLTIAAIASFFILAGIKL